MSDETPIRPFDAFVRQYVEDREAGKVRGVREYLDLFPGDEESIGREYFLREDQSPDTEPRQGTLGPYELQEELGRGGQGIVYRAIDTRIDRTVALKVLRGLGSVAADTLGRFKREAQAAAKTDHPGVCPVYDADISGGVPYIAMRYVEGETLAAWIASVREGHATAADTDATRPLLDRERMVIEGPDAATTAALQPSTPARSDVEKSVRLVERTARALHAVHEAGVIHRDVKPGNIMITPDGDPVIMDFGLAGGSDAGLVTLTCTGDVFGTPVYMAPEQINPTRERIDRRADVWALGVILYECATGTRPFQAPSRDGLYQAILSQEPTDPRRLNTAVPLDLATVITTALAKDRNHRYATADALADDLAAVLDQRPVAARPVGSVERFTRWCRRESAKAALLFTLLIGLPAFATLLTNYLNDRQAVERQRRADIEAAKDERLARGFMWLAEWVHDRAFKKFESALAMEGGSPEAVAGIVLAHLGDDDPDAASRTLDTHGRLLGDRRAAVALRVQILEAQGRTNEAESLRTEIPEPSDALDYYLLGLEHRMSVRYGDVRAFVPALAAFQRSILLAASPRALYYHAAVNAAANTDDVDATQRLVRAMNHHWPGSPNGAFWTGYAMGNGDPAAAEAAYRRALDADPRFDEAWYHLGLVLDKQGRGADAIEAYRRCLALKPDTAVAWCNLGNGLIDSGETEEGLAALRTATKHDPRLPEPWVGLGKALLRSDPTAAIEAFERAIEAAPRGESDVRYDIGVAYRVGGKNAEAVREFRRAVEADPANAAAWYDLGWCYQAMGRPVDAVDANRRVLALPDPLPEASCNLGQMFARMGFFRDAVDFLRDGDQRGRARGNWPYDVPEWIDEVQQLLDPMAPAMAEAERLIARFEKPGNGRLSDLTAAARAIGKIRAPLAWWEAALASDRDLLASINPPHLVEALRTAVAAMCGLGDAAALDPAERTRCRTLARVWLRSALDAWTGKIDEGGPAARRIARILKALEDDTGLLTAIRPATSIELPDDERKLWSALWAEVERIREAAE